MTTHAELAPELQLTVEEFLAFTETRPNGERWELIEGRAVMNPSPTDCHQTIVLNIGGFLIQEKLRLGASWLPLLGVGTRVPISENSLPQPDLMVKAEPARDSPVSDESLVLFEVLSKSNTKADQVWRRKVYASVPNCQHYVTISTKTLEVVVYDRTTGWKSRTIVNLSSAVELSAIGVSLPLAVIYRWTPLASVTA
jgi:Uma2 family endonuclease